MLKIKNVTENKNKVPFKIFYEKDGEKINFWWWNFLQFLGSFLIIGILILPSTLVEGPNGHSTGLLYWIDQITFLAAFWLALWGWLIPYCFSKFGVYISPITMVKRKSIKDIDDKEFYSGFAFQFIGGIAVCFMMFGIATGLETFSPAITDFGMYNAEFQGPINGTMEIDYSDKLWFYLMGATVSLGMIFMIYMGNMFFTKKIDNEKLLFLVELVYSFVLIWCAYLVNANTINIFRVICPAIVSLIVGGSPEVVWSFTIAIAIMGGLFILHDYLSRHQSQITRKYDIDYIEI